MHNALCMFTAELDLNSEDKLYSPGLLKSCINIIKIQQTMRTTLNWSPNKLQQHMSNNPNGFGTALY